MAEDLYTHEQICSVAPFFQTKGGSAIVSAVERMTKLKKLNDTYRKCSAEEGPDFAEAMLKEFGIEYSIGGLDLKDLPTGQFIPFRNHLYGGADGLVLVELFAHLRSDIKAMVYQILGLA